MTRRGLIAAIAIGVAALGLAAVLLIAWSQPREVAYVVPAGTAARIAAGETVNVLPATIFLRTGDTLTIRNDDSAVVQVGPFPVQPGQRFSHQYRTAGTYDLACTVHASGRLRVIVQ